MPRRASIESTPPAVRDVVERAILAEGFANYDKLAERFGRLGNGFSRSSLHRYGQRLRERRERARMEAEILAALGDTVGWLVKWARSYPREAERLVRRLKVKEDAMTGGQR